MHVTSVMLCIVRVYVCILYLIVIVHSSSCHLVVYLLDMFHFCVSDFACVSLTLFTKSFKVFCYSGMI